MQVRKGFSSELSVHNFRTISQTRNYFAVITWYSTDTLAGCEHYVTLECILYTLNKKLFIYIVECVCLYAPARVLAFFPVYICFTFCYPCSSEYVFCHYRCFVINFFLLLLRSITSRAAANYPNDW